MPLPMYIHWFKPLQTFNFNINMFQVSCAMRQWQLHTEVIWSLTSCNLANLIPKYPTGAADPLWTHGHALAQAEMFYLNRYINFRLFEQYRIRAH